MKSSAISEKDFLITSGKNLVNKNGKKIILKGVNAGSYLFQEFWMTLVMTTKNVSSESELYSCLTDRFGKEKLLELIDAYQDSYWTDADFDNCASLGMNCIRLPFWYRNLVDENGAIKSDAFKRIDWFVNEAGKRGMYVILDFHGAPGSQNGSDHSGVDGRKEKIKASKFFFGEESDFNQKLYYSIFEAIAKHYKDNPVIAGYDLLNEPFCTYRYNSGKSDKELHELLWNVYDCAYKKIRAIDQNHIIIMEATWDPVDLPAPSFYGWENVMYEYHNYYYGDYNNFSGHQISNMKHKLNLIKSADYDVPSYLGEFNYFADYKAWDDGLKLLEESGINWTVWSYKTTVKNGNWGLFYNDFKLRPLNIETASYEQIQTLFSSMQTAEKNTLLLEVLKKYF